MVPNQLMFKSGSALIAVGIVLLTANWYAKPEAWLAWTAALAMFGIMTVALYLAWRTVRNSALDAATARSLAQIPKSVVFAAVMMGVPLALTLFRAFDLVEGPNVARRAVGVLTGALLVMIGNAMPKNLPPLSSGCDNARQQVFQRRLGWTWVLCGLASAIGWLALPIDFAETGAILLVVTAMAVSIVHLVLLARRASSSPPAN